jgi:hypothetical protein
MRYFLLMVLLITLATACVFHALLAGAVMAPPPADEAAQSTEDAASSDYHFGTWSNMLLQLCVIMMGADYDAFNALLLLPGACCLVPRATPQEEEGWGAV